MENCNWNAAAGKAAGKAAGMDEERFVTRHECGARHEAIDVTLSEIKTDNRRMFWLQLSNLGGVIAILTSILSGIAVGALLYYLKGGV